MEYENLVRITNEHAPRGRLRHELIELIRNEYLLYYDKLLLIEISGYLNFTLSLSLR